MPIDPVDEQLVSVADIHPRVIDDSQYHQMGLPGALPAGRTREGVAERLARVADGLPRPMTLVVWDAWRSYETQQALYEGWMAALARRNPDWTQDVLHRETARYVSVPSRDPDRPAPHYSGGAVDLTLGDHSGRPLDCGTEFDAFVPQAATTALEGVDGAARDNRRLLFWSMIEQGFTSYAEEWWHFDYGDQFWGSITGQSAIYGPIEARG